MEIKNQHIEVEKASVRAVLAGKCQVVDAGKFSTAKSEVVYGVLLPESAK